MAVYLASDAEMMPFDLSKQDILVDKTFVNIPFPSDLFDMRPRRFSSSSPARARPRLTHPVPRQQAARSTKKVHDEARVAVLKNVPGKCKRDSIPSMPSFLGFEDAVVRVDVPLKEVRENKRVRMVGKGDAFVHFFNASDCRRFVQVAEGRLRLSDRTSGKVVTAEVYELSKAGASAREL